MTTRITRAMGGAVVVAALLFAAPATAQAQANTTTTNEVGTGAALVVANLLYMPVKVIYAATGGLVAGAAYAVSGGDREVVEPIMDAAFRGDYVIDKEHLRRQKQVEFIGRRAAYNPVQNVAAEPPAYEEPSYETPSSYDTPAYEEPAYEPSSAEPPY